MRLINEANYDIKTLQTRLINILEGIDKVCAEHNLTYFLWAGTMLGAVRHKGFIPWDDDMDIAMPRKDYEILLAHGNEWMPEPFEVIGPHNRPDYPYPFAKVVDAGTTVIERPDFKHPEGIYVDIFPLDGMTGNMKERKFHMKKYKFYRHMLFFRGRDPFKHGKGHRSWFPLLLHQIFSMEGLQKKLQKIMARYDYDNSEFVIDYDSCERGIVPKYVVEGVVDFEFGGKVFKGLKNYDAYLSHNYGDYMTPPPKDKQIQHNFYYIDLDMPYREFIKNGGMKK